VNGETALLNTVTTTDINQQQYWMLYNKGDVIALNGSPFQSHGASPAVWDHTVLPATQHRWTRPSI